MWKTKKTKKKNSKIAFNTERVLMAAKVPLENVYTHFQTRSRGLTDEEVEERQGLYGKNEIEHEKKKRPLVMLAKAFINPFVGVLTVLVAISFVMDVWMADPGDKDWTSIVVVTTMIVLSALLRFTQEWKANRSSEALQKMVTNTCYMVRAGTASRGGTPGDEKQRGTGAGRRCDAIGWRHDSGGCAHHRVEGPIREPVEFDGRVRLDREVCHALEAAQALGLQHRRPRQYLLHGV